MRARGQGWARTVVCRPAAGRGAVARWSAAVRWSAVVRWSAAVVVSGCLAASGAEATGADAAAGTGERRLCWIFLTARPDSGGGTRAALTGPALERMRRARARVGDRDRPVHEDYVAQLERIGVRPRVRSRWLHAVSAYLDRPTAQRAASLPFVRGVAPAGRLVGGRPDRAPDAPPAARSDGRLAIGLDGPSSAAPAALPAARSDGRMAIGLDGPSAFDENFYGPSFNQLALLGVPDLHAAGWRGDGVRIVSLDSGFHYEHHVFDSLAILDQRDYFEGDGDVQNTDRGDRHGTLTLSALAGWLPGHLVGPAYGASVALARTEEVAWERRVEVDHYVAALEWAADTVGADIVTASLGYLEFPDDDPPFVYPPDSLDGGSTVISRAVNTAAARGVLVVISAGNEGPQPGSLLLPADADSGLSVGAVAPWGELRASSSRGPTWTGDRIKPDLCAQGQDVVCAAWDQALGAYLTQSSGTSLATPLIAGLAALMIEAQPDLRGRPLEVIERLHASGDQASRPDHDRGYGVPWGPLALDPEAATLVVDSLEWVGTPRVDQWSALRVRLRNAGGAEASPGSVAIAGVTAGSVHEGGAWALGALAAGDARWVGPWDLRVGDPLPGGGRQWIRMTIGIDQPQATLYRSIWAEVFPAQVADLRHPVRIERLAPQPWLGSAPLRVDYFHLGEGEADLDLFDTAGRRVMRLARDAPLRAGGGSLLLDSASSARLPSGFYLLRLASPRGRAVERLVRIR